MHISKQSHFINADVYVLKGSDRLGISDLRQSALNDVQCNRVLGCDIYGNNV